RSACTAGPGFEACADAAIGEQAKTARIPTTAREPRSFTGYPSFPFAAFAGISVYLLANLSSITIRSYTGARSNCKAQKAKQLWGGVFSKVGYGNYGRTHISRGLPP